MKRLYVLGLAAVCIGWMASALWATPASAGPSSNPVMNSAHYALDWAALGEISGGASASAHYQLNATIGQMAAGSTSRSAHFAACSGFECVLQRLSLYLPLITR